MKNLLLRIWQKIATYSFALTALVALSVVLSAKIVHNIRKNDEDKHNSILLLTKTAEAATFQGFIPPKSALPMLERAYRIGGSSLKPYAGFLSSCFYIHNDPLRGAYYAGLAFGNASNSRDPSPSQVLLKEIADAQANADYYKALEKSHRLLELTSSLPDCPTLQFLTLLRIMEIKEILNQDTETEFKKLQSLPLFKDFEQFYKDGGWTLSRRFGKKN